MRLIWHSFVLAGYTKSYSFSLWTLSLKCFIVSPICMGLVLPGDLIGFRGRPPPHTHTSVLCRAFPQGMWSLHFTRIYCHYPPKYDVKAPCHIICPLYACVTGINTYLQLIWKKVADAAALVAVLEYDSLLLLRRLLFNMPFRPGLCH